MKKKLLFTALFATALGFSQTNLVQNGTADLFQGVDGGSNSDNADSWDMTPNSTVKYDGGNGDETASPYRYDEVTNPNGWYNSTLQDYIQTTYFVSTIDEEKTSVDAQPGSSSDGSYVNGVKTRGVKVYDDADDKPTVTHSTRRLYQKIVVEAGAEYTFSIDSRSEAAATPSDVFMLNEEITTEAGLENGASDPRVDAYLQITNDENSSKGSAENNTFTTNSFDFTASTTTVVIYVRALAAVSKSHEVFYDNISLIKKETASRNSVLASKFSVYPNPANDVVNVKSADVAVVSVEVYDVLGKKVKEVSASKVDVSNLVSGVYVLKVNTEEGTFNTRIIVD